MALQSALDRQATQVCVLTLQLGGLAPPQFMFEMHSTQVCVITVSQTGGLAPPQSALLTQPKHMLFAVSHEGVLPVQPPLSTQSTQVWSLSRH